MTEDRLDETTERAIEAFGAAKWKHGHHGPGTERMNEVERYANLLRFRIRELVEKARAEQAKRQREAMRDFP